MYILLKMQINNFNLKLDNLVHLSNYWKAEYIDIYSFHEAMKIYSI
jgi:hypothetical protein